MSVTKQLIDDFRLKLRLRDAVDTRGADQQRGTAVLPWRDKTLLGYMAISVAKTDGLNDALWIDDLAVQPGSRGKGIGASFFLRIAQNWHSTRYDEVHLLIRHRAPQQQHALRLYTALGFTVETDSSLHHYEKLRTQQYMTAKQTDVLQNATRLLEGRPLRQTIDIVFAFDQRWMTNNAPRVWQGIETLYGDMHGAGDGDQAPIEEVLQDGRDGSAASMFLVALSQ